MDQRISLYIVDERGKGRVGHAAQLTALCVPGGVVLHHHSIGQLGDEINMSESMVYVPMTEPERDAFIASFAETDGDGGDQ